jgi:serine/threonine protein kinase
MSAGPVLPRRFGSYLLTEALGEDALGRVFRAVRLSGERAHAHVRVLESPEIDENAVLDAIEANGEVHSFLNNPAIARGVQMDAVEGVPFIAWNEPSGRTLDRLIAMVRGKHQQVPVEHALLIGEKVAAALDHAYNTTVDGERTLHGLVWPGFISISDDGEIRLAGFGLAPGIAPSMARPRFAREIARYLAPEHVASGQIGKSSDVYSVGAILFELLFGRLPNASNPLGDLRAAAQQMPQISSELVRVLLQCLSAPESRFPSSGELRRELGKILFSGPYAPSTFNLAFFLNSLFASEIEAETRQRARELSLDPGTVPEMAAPAPRASPSPPPRESPQAIPRMAPTPPRRRSWAAFGGAALVLAAFAATAYLILQRSTARGNPGQALPRATVTRAPIAAATAPPVASAPTAVPTPDSQFKDEVARRVAQEIRKLESEMLRKGEEKAPEAAAAEPPVRSMAASASRPISSPASPTPAPPEPTAAPQTESESVPAPAPTAPPAAPDRKTRLETISMLK